MTPFIDLVVEALNLMHPRFARANGADSFRLVFYHTQPVPFVKPTSPFQVDPKTVDQPAPR